MRCKVKWRAQGEEPLQPESFEAVEGAKARARELIAKYGEHVTIDIWNDDETWQIVSFAGVADWAKSLT